MDRFLSGVDSNIVDDTNGRKDQTRTTEEINYDTEVEDQIDNDIRRFYILKENGRRIHKHFIESIENKILISLDISNKEGLSRNKLGDKGAEYLGNYLRYTQVL